MTTFLLANSDTSTYHQFARLQSMTEWWQWLLLLIVCSVILAYIAITYRRDSIELPGPVRWSLLVLRVLAFAGILFYFMDLEKRSQRQLVKDSRALVLIDTSLSMGIQDEAPGTDSRKQRRIDAVLKEMQRGELVKELRQKHEVVVYRFDQIAVPTEIASFSKLGDSPGSTSSDTQDRSSTSNQRGP